MVEGLRPSFARWECGEESTFACSVGVWGSIFVMRDGSAEEEGDCGLRLRLGGCWRSKRTFANLLHDLAIAFIGWVAFENVADGIVVELVGREHYDGFARFHCRSIFALDALVGDRGGVEATCGGRSGLGGFRGSFGSRGPGCVGFGVGGGLRSAALTMCTDGV